MTTGNPSLIAWSWAFMLMYLVGMIAFGIFGQRRIAGGDDYATARGSYGPFVLAIALASTTASGATFLGLPGLAYTHGVSSLWVGLIYPVAIYLALLVGQQAIAQAGNRLGNRSIPEFLGDRFQSDALRLATSVFSLVLLFYLAAQLVAGLAMFEMLLGIGRPYALGITAGVMLCYVLLGGAHADILTDALQGGLMLLIAIAVCWMFFTGFGIDGGYAAMLERIASLDSEAFSVMRPDFPLAASVWALIAMFLAYVPMGFLPHIGNKLWALKNSRDRLRFIMTAFLLGLIFPLASLGGLLARAVLGDELLVGPLNPNSVIPALFITLFPAWLAALLGAAILSAIMSTSDGLVISSSQVFANDLYRRTLAKRLHPDQDRQALDVRVLRISRYATLLIMVAASVLAWYTVDINIALLTWYGIGGMVAGLAGPLVLGLFWRGMTRAGALSGFFGGTTTFIVLHTGWFPANWFEATWFADWANWLAAQAPNPYACATIGEIVSVTAGVVVSRFTPGVPPEHLERIFGET
jgi:SSS family transporter